MRRSIAFLALLLTGASATAAEFGVIVQPPASGGGLGACTIASAFEANPVRLSGSCSGNSLGNSGGAARAEFGEVGAETYANQFNGSVTIPSIYEAQASFSDVVTFTSADPLQQTTIVALNLDLDGSIEGAIGGSLTISASLARSFSSLALRNFDTGVINNGFTLLDGTVVGAGLTNARLRTRFVEVPLNAPVSIGLRMEARSGHVGGSGQVLFNNSFGVPFGRDVFQLSDGITANSGTWLVNNRRLGPAVPEPATWAMMISGLGLAGAAVRRRGTQIAHA